MTTSSKTVVHLIGKPLEFFPEEFYQKQEMLLMFTFIYIK